MADKDGESCLWVLAFLVTVAIIAFLVTASFKDDDHDTHHDGNTVIIDRHSTRAPLKAPKTYKAPSKSLKKR